MIKAFLVLATLASTIHAQAYRFGRVWDGEKVLTNAVIVVEKDRIKSVGTSDAGAIDMSRYTAVPGLIDVHTHLTYVLDANRITQAGRGAAAAAAGNEISLGEVRLLPPLHPPSMRDFVSFEAHVAGVRRAVEGKEGVPESWYEQPTFMFMSPHAVVGANDLVPIPAGCKLLDYELEVAAVIGQDGRDLTPKQAAEHIAGYTILNDWSARDLQSREMRSGLGPAKGKDFASTLGPCIVTAD